MELRTIDRLSENYVKVDYQDELIQIIREGIYNMNQKALVNKFVLRKKKSLIDVHVHFLQDRAREIYRSRGDRPLAGLQ